jgi:hypothetical protein
MINRIFLFLSLIAVYGELKSQQILAGVPGLYFYDIISDTLLNVSNNGDPDELYSIDINSDGINDIRLSSTLSISPSHTTAYVMVVTLNANTRLSFGSRDSTYNGYLHYYMTRDILKKYNLNDSIFSNNFIPLTYGYLGYYYSYVGTTAISSQWINAGDKYFGVKYEDNNGIAYGWVKVNCQGSNNVLILEHSLGNQIIGLENKEIKTNIQIYPNPATDELTIELPIEIDIKEIKLIDICGKEYPLSFFVEGNGYKIRLTNFTAGLYFVELKTASGFVRKKVIVE